MDSGIVGRDAELLTAAHALDAAGTVLLEGPAGIGKTALWRALLARAEARGWRVLSCAPTESETTLLYAALADLLRPLADLIGTLPPPQRAAAEAVLLWRDADEPVDERTVGAATRSLLELVAAADRPHVVAIDDVQWLDRPSGRALRFALRRVPGLPVLAAARTDGTDPVPLDLDRRVGELTRIDLEPLGVGAFHHLIRARFGRPLSRPLLSRIVRETGGNPLRVIEVTRAVLRLPRLPRPNEELPVTASSRQLVGEALARLPQASREGIRLASLLSVPRLAHLSAAGVTARSLEPAEVEGLVTIGPETVEFAHPVYAAAVRADIPAGVRRRLHRRLAETVDDPDERARHLAWSTLVPDVSVATELARAAARQHARGGPELAADLYERAAELTPPSERRLRDRHRLAAARCRLDSGDYPAVVAATDAVIADADADQRAEALLLRAIVAWNNLDAGVGKAVTLAQQALTAAGPGTVLAGRVHVHLSSFEDDPDAARRHAEAAVALLSTSERPSDRALLSSALLLQFFHEVRAGLPPRTELLERGLALEAGRPSFLAGTVPAIWWKGIDEHDRARARLTELLRWATARGDEPWQLELLTHLAENELLAGAWAAAERYIRAARQLGELQENGLAAEDWLAGMLAAYRGSLVEARRAADTGLRRAQSLDDAWCRRINLHLAGFVALSAGRAREAVAAYTALAAECDRLGLVEPLPLRFEPDWIEACLASGDLDTAAAGLDRLAERHRRLPRPWTRLGLARCRLLFAGATGADTTAALAELGAATEAVPADALPLDRARCHLVAGIAHRRARRKRQAREELEAALRGFTALGAAAFAERARSELARVGERATAPWHLTATERRVAELAARGRTNRAIADELFLSPKTVEANLARVYRKLGITSRAQLGTALAAHGGQG